MTCRSQRKGLTIMSGCDLGEMCHLGLYLLHAVIVQVVVPNKLTHAPSSNIAFNTVNDSQTLSFYAPPGD